MNLQTGTGAARLALNMKFLAIRLFGILVRMVPFRAFFLNSLGIITGLLFMLLRIRQWGAIKRFARHTGSPLPPLLYIVKYFVQQGKDGIWGYVFCEAPSVLDQYVTSQNMETVKDALTKGRGAVVLVAHYGPSFYAYMLNRMHFDIKALFAQCYVRRLQNAETLVLKPLRSEKIMFLNNSGVVLEAHKDEKHLVEHVRKGGMVTTANDFPGSAKQAETIPFLRLSICPHVFMFRLALKYDIPVFFCLFRNVRQGGYRMEFIPSGQFSTPEEGFRRYLSHLQAQIEENPFMWGLLPRFFTWS